MRCEKRVEERRKEGRGWNNSSIQQDKQISTLAVVDCPCYPPLLSPVHQVQKPRSQKLRASSEGRQLKQHLSQDHRGGWSAPSPAEIQGNRTRRPVTCELSLYSKTISSTKGDLEQGE